ncbi:hypothetical protein [Hamadaea tsunoensis]|uniref:hypothetical protein n=1 Tax=Hamadaea tsunoensis TaxID=53368 RepID=UPI00040B46B1|nr:hypothetical protein [Hamadaea tsunoensis]
MIEILEQLDTLTRPDLDPATVTVGGVALGARAVDVIDRDRISQALACARTRNAWPRSAHRMR